ncbi:hypothetical protein [Idiomarina aminovorans]|uniref:hypothetical protein n=1 Tax=Idiomarina aminovorans TaxID=2914829 RepID=UPI0020033631|nr:hypothetical protein [Idiomarina sp. ATCH4]MCK7460413.1 hypothetical protein [Idiomarina sp. ATCH4]
MRNHFDGVDGMLLSLVKEGVNSTNALAHFSGLAVRNINKKMAGLYGLGFLLYEQNDVATLTELGARSLNQGRAVTHVNRGLLYCGITERLLPREAYDKRFIGTQDLTEDDLKFILVAQEKQKISLNQLKEINALDYTTKKQLNLPDEVEQLVSIEDYASGFIQAQLLVAGKVQPQKAWTQFGSCFRDYPLNKVPQITGFRASRRRAIERVREALSQEGVITDSDVNEHAPGVIQLIVRKVNKRWLGSTTASYLPNIIRCRSEYVAARPFYRYPVKTADALKGNTLIVDLSQLDEKTQQDALALSKFYKKKAHFFKTPRVERIDRNFQAFVQRRLTQTEQRELLNIANELGIKPMQKWLQPANGD